MNSLDNSLSTAPPKPNETAESSMDNLQFSYLPAYAKFLLDHNVRALAEEQLRLSRSLNLPLLRFFETFTDEELITIASANLEQLLGLCAGNRAADYIHVSLKKWLADQLPVITRNQIVAEDIVGSSRVDLQACKLEYSIVSPK